MENLDLYLKKIIDSLGAKLLKNELGTPFGLSLISTEFRNYPVSEILPTIALWDPINDEFKIDMEKIKENAKEKNIEYLQYVIAIIFHELSHRVLDHYSRLQNRNKIVWNIATDIFINSIYLDAIWASIDPQTVDQKPLNISKFHDIFEKLDGAVDNDKQFENNYEEEIYKYIKDNEWEEEEMMISLSDLMKQINDQSNQNGQNGQSNQNDKENNGSCNSGRGSNQSDDSESNSGNNDSENSDESNDQQNDSQNEKIKVKITRYKGKIINVEIDENSLPQEAKEQADKNNQKLNGQNKLANQMMKENIKKRGFGSQLGDHIIDGLIKIKIPWEKILKDSMITVLAKTEELGWQKIRKTSYTWGVLFPDYIEEEIINCVIIAIDESGSMSDEELKKGLSVVLDLSDMYDNIIVIKHDYNVTDYQIFEDVSHDISSNKDKIIKYARNRKSSGGTSHKDVFVKIRDEFSKKIDISTILLFTDGYSDINEYIYIIDRYKRSTFTILTDSRYKKEISKACNVVVVE